MKLSRIVFCLVGWLGVCLAPMRAQDTWMPYVFGKQYSATEMISTDGGTPIESRIYVDDGNIRMEEQSAAGEVVAIIRPDLQTIYWAIVTRKQLLILPFDSERIKKEVPPESALPGQSEPLGPETILGIVCKKYRLTNASGRTFLLWTDAQQNTPVKISSKDGAYVLVWKNYRIGPQAAGLFVPPNDFRDVEIPLLPRLPAPTSIPPKGLGQ
ncbi:MAG: hypothetical protein LV481_15580 [Methylacidiphilales bacterium]|nr:hypothetical protein [Candidatus Methylacidiphilales bacterium]